jgi:hypothetical protein
MEHSNDVTICECGGQMRRDWQASLPHAGNRVYRRSIVSDSLAVTPAQVEEHRRLFPDVKMLDDGRPVFDSYKTHDDYLKKTGFVKQPQKIKHRTKKATVA